MPPAAIEAFARAVAAGVGAIPAPARRAAADPFAAAVVADLKAHRGSSLVVAGETQPPTCTRSPTRSTRRSATPARPSATRRPRRRARRRRPPLSSSSRADMEAGRVATLVDPRRQPRLQRAGRPRVRRGAGEGRAAHPPRRSTTTRPRASATGTWPRRTRSRPGATRAPSDGTVTILQPLIAPLYGGKTAHEVLAAFSAEPERTAHDIVQDDWRGKLPGGRLRGRVAARRSTTASSRHRVPRCGHRR